MGWITYVVVDGRDDTTSSSAVTRKVDAAGLRWVVVGVDEVERRAEAAGARGTEAIGPGGDIGKVVGAGVAEDLLGKLLSSRFNKVRGDVCDSIMAEHSPGVGEGESGERNASNGRLHGEMSIFRRSLGLYESQKNRGTVLLCMRPCCRRGDTLPSWTRGILPTTCATWFEGDVVLVAVVIIESDVTFRLSWSCSSAGSQGHTC